MNNEKLVRIMTVVLEEYPELEGVLLEGGLDDPSSLTFMKLDDLKGLAEDTNVEVQEFESDLEYDRYVPKIGHDDDDEGGLH